MDIQSEERPPQEESTYMPLVVDERIETIMNGRRRKHKQKKLQKSLASSAIAIFILLHLLLVTDPYIKVDIYLATVTLTFSALISFLCAKEKRPALMVSILMLNVAFFARLKMPDLFFVAFLAIIITFEIGSALTAKKY